MGRFLPGVESARFSGWSRRGMIPQSHRLILQEVGVPKELDLMVCRACGNEERASEGYPCDECGTFICLVCNMRGITKCKQCAEKAGGAATQAKP
jgi:hypothetical protein